jgi:hypothetical protein
MKYTAKTLTLLWFIIGSCNTALLVPKDRVILKREGCLLYRNNDVEFIPMRIDTSLTLAENLTTQKLKLGYYLPPLWGHQKQYLNNFIDTTVKHWHAVPVCLYYRKIYNSFPRSPKQEYKPHLHPLALEKKNIHYKVQQGHFQIINIGVKVSERFERSIKQSEENE